MRRFVRAEREGGCLRDPARVLVVDDEQQVKAALVRVFDRAGYRATGAGSAEEALALMSDSDFDLVVTDIVMDGLDGVELLGRIRKEHAALPVILVTAYSKEEYEERAQEQGAFAYLRKPVSRKRLLTIADQALVSAQDRNVPNEGTRFS